MDIEATLKDGTWADVKVFSNEEELPTKEYANPQKIQDRMDEEMLKSSVSDEPLN